MGQLSYSLSYSPVEVAMYSASQRERVYRESLLPLDIIALISEELLAMGCTGELAALSLLGKHYTDTVQRKLFRHIDISTYRRYARLKKTLQFGSDSPERCYALASMVRCLSVNLNTYPLQGERQLRSRDLFNLYYNLPMLEFVDLTEAPVGGLGRNLVPDEDDLDTLGSSTLRSVTLIGHLGPVGWSMLIGIPHLTELHLLGDIPTSLFSYAPPLSGRSIRRLTWGTSMPPTLRRIRWVFDSSEESIGGELVLSAPPDSESELMAIRQYALRRGMDVRVADSVDG